MAKLEAAPLRQEGVKTRLKNKQETQENIDSIWKRKVKKSDQMQRKRCIKNHLQPQSLQQQYGEELPFHILQHKAFFSPVPVP